MIITKLNSKKLPYSAILFLAVFFALFENIAYASNSIAPEIIPRSVWGGSKTTPDWPVEYGNAEKFVIHHTASSTLTPDADGSGKYTDMVESIFDYHSEKKTWYDDDGEYVGFGDIGYNYIIDPNGNIYEGRAGGNGSTGGHVKGFNVGSIGISVLGRYQGYLNSKNENVPSHPVTDSILDSLKNLIGWLASANNIDLNATTEFHGKNIDGIVGHRDLSATICPGNDLYSKLSEIQNSAVIKKTEFDKYAYQIPGDRSIYVIDEGYKLKFNSLGELPSGHRNKNVIAASEAQLDLFRYKDSTIYPDGSLLQEFGSNAVYYIDKQEKRHLNMKGEEFSKMGFDNSKIIYVFKSDLNIYKEGKNIKYGPDGKLVKDASSKVYLIQSGKKRGFTSAKLFEFLGYRWKNIELDENIGLYLDGGDMLYPDKSLVKTAASPNVYFIENKQKRKITSDTLFNKLGYKTKNVITIEDVELSHFPSAKNMTYPDGTLLQQENRPSVYLVANGSVRIFPSAELFLKLGYKWKNVTAIKADEFKNYSYAGRVLQPNGTLIRPLDGSDIYLVDNGTKRKISSALMFEKLGYKWNSVLPLPPDQINEYPSGENLKYPDGTLIKKEGSGIIYRIDGGKIREFTSQTLFEKTGSKWTDVVTLPANEFAAYAYGGIVMYPNKTLLREKGKDAIYVIKDQKALGIKSLAEFNKAGYKWKDVIDLPKEEITLMIDPGKAFQRDATPQYIPAKSPAKSADALTSQEKTEPPASNTSANKPVNPDIKIAIYSITEGSVRMTANGPYKVDHMNGDGTIQKTEKRSANEQTEIAYFNSASYVKFTPSSKDTVLEVVSYNDPSWNNAVNDNRFRGNIIIKYSDISDKLWIVNELPLEDYVNGIAETTSESHNEYLKAFSIIARTYAMYYIERGGKHIGEPFHLKNSRNGNGNDQSYKGYNFEIRADKIVLASRETAGKIITFNGKPIVAAYSSDSGGVTKSACDVLSKTYCNSDFSYLSGGANDPDETVHDRNKMASSHGAGMSAVGALKMAENGTSLQNMIAHYYPGVEIIKYY